MKYAVRPTAQFQRDLKRAEKQGRKMDLLTDVIKKLASGETLDKRHNDHPLKGEYKDCRECHVTPDRLPICELDKDVLILYLMRTGTHSDLF